MKKLLLGALLLLSMSFVNCSNDDSSEDEGCPLVETYGVTGLPDAPTGYFITLSNGENIPTDSNYDGYEVGDFYSQTIP